MRLKLTQSRSGLILSAVEATEKKAKIFSKIKLTSFEACRLYFAFNDIDDTADVIRLDDISF